MIVIETPRLVLRRFTPNDLGDLVEMLSNPAVMRYYPKVMNEDEARVWLDKIFMRYEKYGRSFYATLSKETGEFVGQVGLLDHGIPEVQETEIGYMLKRKHWGCGYASEAARGCRDYAFGTLGIEKVISIIDPRNEPSMRVARAVGMKFEKSMFIQKFGQVENVFSVSR